MFDFIKDQDFDTLLDIAVQLCSLVNYLHMRGFLLCNVNLNELFVLSGKEKPYIKISSMSYIEGIDRSIIFDKENNYFKSPEAFQFGSYTRSSDVYLIGALMFYIFSKKSVEGSNFRDELAIFESSDNIRIRGIIDIIKKCTSLKPSDRYCSVQEIVKDINLKLNSNYTIIDKKVVQRLCRYNTRLISREHYIKKIISSAKEYLYENSYQPKATIVRGGTGTGKSIFTKLTAYRLGQEGINVVLSALSEDVSNSFYYIIMVIKDIIKYADKELIDRYISDISCVMPEISGTYSTSIGNSVLRSEDKVRLIYRLGNFLLETSVRHPFVMAVRGFDWVDEDSLSVLNYIIRSEGKGKIYLLMGVGIQSIEEKPKLQEFCNTLTDMGYAESIELNNFNINETAEYIRLLLGTDKSPLDFAAKIYKQTEGNPGFIYEVIYYLFINDYIYVNDEGEWVLNEVDLENINLSFNIDNLALNKLSRLSPTQYRTVKMISIFNTAVSADILGKMLNMNDEELGSLLAQLDNSNVLSRKVDDWGISYDFRSINLKKSIYERIPQEEKLKYHELASYVLEEKFTRENRENKDELVYHMTKANRLREAIEYLMASADKMIASNLISQAIQFLEQTYNMFPKEETSQGKIVVCSKMGELYEQLGEYSKSMYFYDIVETMGECLKDSRVLVDVCIKKFSLLYQLSEKKGAIEYALKAKRLLRNIDYPEGLYELIIMLHDIMSNKRKYNSYIRILERVLANIDRERHEGFYARLLAAYGRIICNRNRYEEGMAILQKAIVILERLGLYKYIPNTLNSIGFIYSEYYNNMQKSREYYEKCLNVSQKQNSLGPMERSYNNLAEMYRIEDRYSEATDYYNKALDVVRISQNMVIKTLLNINLIIVSIEMEDYKKVKEYINISEELLVNLKDSDILPQYFYQYRAEFYYSVGEYEKAMEYAQKAVDMCISWGIAENNEAHLIKMFAEIELRNSLDYDS
ncbi:MAG: tetratricopeptide repeat protein, partial [Caulobacteraceae bacterium]